VLAVDFARGQTPPAERGIFAHFRGHGHVTMPDLVDLLREAGLDVIEHGPVGTRDLHFALATKPARV
jgi:hypothetical protein